MPDVGSFLGVPGVDVWLFSGLTLAAMATTFMSVVTGTAGGLMLLVVMASFIPATVLVPIHTIVQLGAGTSRAVTMWRYVLKETLLPFLLGSFAGAFIGAQFVVTLPTGVLQGILGSFIMLVVWVPNLGRFGPERGRFAIVGLVASLLGMFVSATGTLVGPFVASASPDRRNHSATVSALMTISHISKISAFAVTGIAIGAFAPLIAAMVAGAAVGNSFGQRTLDRMDEAWFRRIFQIVMSVLAARLIWSAVLSLWR